MAGSRKQHRVVIVGAGFAGYNAARELSRLAGATTEIVVINSTDYFLYVPLMPQVAAGLLEPRHILASLPGRLRRMRFVLGTVNHIDQQQKIVGWAGPEGAAGEVGYDRLILTAGSVNKLLPVPGIADYAHGFRTIAEAVYLRDHIIRQLELAAVDEFMKVPSAPDVYACGDCAAVPDLTRAGQVTGMTAQRQGNQVARNAAASFGIGTAAPYKHHDLSFLVNLGGLAAAANPLQIPLSGLAANAVTRGYHLNAMSGNRMRVLTDWALNAVTPPEATSLAVVTAESVPLDANHPRT